MKGQSPNEVLSGFIDKGWGKAALSRPEVLALAFAEEVERMPDRCRVSYAPKRGGAIYFYHDALLGMDRKITLRVPAFNPEFVFCFDGDELICQAFAEQTFGVLDTAGAVEGGRRGKAFRRHIAHLPDAPEVPVAVMVDAGMIDRMARLAGMDREALLERHERTRRAMEKRWKTVPNQRLAAFRFLEE